MPGLERSERCPAAIRSVGRPTPMLDLRARSLTMSRGLVTPAVDNRQFYEHDVFDQWASRTGLTDIEERLVKRFLKRDLSTLEAGTGGGRILHELAERGFHDLHGFDYVPGFIDVARARDASGSIDFTVQDAVDLDYPDGRFEQAIYVQQVLCFIEDPAARFRAMQEAFRVLQPGATALFSFLCFESRTSNPIYAAFTRFLRIQRRFRRRRVSAQYQPWLMAEARPNLGALADRGPYVYWYTLEEALDALDRVGFDITWAAVHGMLFVACRRP
jgi:ubiquinone/menaquinone biosynthesis C-methylase UbiE